MVDISREEFDLRFAKIRALDELRYRRALEVMTPDNREVLLILPLLLHYNTPKIPGYRDNDVPFGIDGFEPNDKQCRWLRQRGVDPEKKVRPKGYSIYALYAMGSTASIGQGVSSDLDVWVCVSGNMPREAQRRLAEKSHFISVWAKSRGADLNLFVTTDNRFTSGEHGTLDTEDCGSAQSLFLLDEFYRTSLRICGRYITWYVVSPQEEKEDYQGTVYALKRSGYINDTQWFDFGSVVKSSPDEYFGSGLWLLYKGIDSPFKAVLKILLMEAYSAEYPETVLLSSSIKGRGIYDNFLLALQQDAYYLMYKKVSRYLLTKGDYERLRLCRICFFLKVSYSLKGLESREVKASRLKFLKRMCRIWNWQRDFQNILTNPDRWKIDFVGKIERELFSSLIKSYRTLLDFSIRHRIEYAITSDDAGVLSRKLYAAFDTTPGKVMLLTSELRPRLWEPYLTFIKPTAGGVCRDDWHMFPSRMGAIEMLRVRPAYVSHSLCQAVAWASFNRLLTDRTECGVSCSDNTTGITAAKIKVLSSELLSAIGDDTPAVTESLLQKPNDMVRCAVVVNFEHDATVDNYVSSADLDYGSALCCGRSRTCLIGSIDVVTLDSWGQLVSQSLPDGEEGIVELLAMLLRINKPQNQDSHLLTENIKICSLSRYHRDLVRFDLEATIRQVFSCYEHPERSFVFEVGRNSYEAGASEERGVAISRHTMLGSADFELQILTRYSMRPEYALQVPPLVDSYATVGVMQYFFVPKGGTLWDIYIVNERNEVRTFEGYDGSRASLVNAINRFYTRQSEDHRGTSLPHFNLPQYFVFSKDLKSLHPFTIKGR